MHSVRYEHFYLSKMLTFSVQVSLIAKNGDLQINRAKLAVTECFILYLIYVQRKHSKSPQLNGYSLSFSFKIGFDSHSER